MVILQFRKLWSKMMTDLTDLTIAEALSAMKSKKISAEELTKA